MSTQYVNFIKLLIKRMENTKIALMEVSQMRNSIFAFLLIKITLAMTVTKFVQSVQRIKPIPDLEVVSAPSKIHIVGRINY